ncbi:MAG: PRC-barrel domain-containing protein [Solirubrobacteraceae bacterium]
MEAGEPASYLTLEEGTEVFSSDGERVGTVAHVLADPEVDVFDGLVIDVQTGPGGLRFVDASQVGGLREGAVTLELPIAQVAELREPSQNPAVMEHHGEEDTQSPLEQKLRRAWDLISGKY